VLTGTHILQHTRPDISSNLDIDIYLDNILEAVRMAAELSVPKHIGNHYNRRTNFLPPEVSYTPTTKHGYQSLEPAQK
jgi:hypothetical protein